MNKPGTGQWGWGQWCQLRYLCEWGPGLIIWKTQGGSLGVARLVSGKPPSLSLNPGYKECCAPIRTFGIGPSCYACSLYDDMVYIILLSSFSLIFWVGLFKDSAWQLVLEESASCLAITTRSDLTCCSSPCIRYSTVSAQTSLRNGNSSFCLASGQIIPIPLFPVLPWQPWSGYECYRPTRIPSHQEPAPALGLTTPDSPPLHTHMLRMRIALRLPRNNLKCLPGIHSPALCHHVFPFGVSAKWPDASAVKA